MSRVVDTARAANRRETGSYLSRPADSVCPAMGPTAGESS
jgi:hypothetical protein